MLTNTIKQFIMYKVKKANRTSLTVNKTYTGMTIEKRIQLMVNNKEPITDSVPLIYTERKEGVRPEYDIRTDRFDLALDYMDKVTQAKLAKRESPEGDIKKDEKPNTSDTDGGEIKDLNNPEGKAQSVQTTKELETK